VAVWKRGSRIQFSRSLAPLPRSEERRRRVEITIAMPKPTGTSELREDTPRQHPQSSTEAMGGVSMKTSVSMRSGATASGNRQALVKSSFTMLLLVSVIVLGFASTAFAAEVSEPIPGVTYAQADNPPSEWQKDGIPRPIVDATVDGWWRYLGDGRFITEAGREFYWRDGKFINPDGSLMEVPASCREHLLLLGIHHQPTAEDVKSEAATSLQAASQATEESTAPALLTAASWSGRYLHLGALHRTSYNVTGVMADVSIIDRAVNHAEYYMVGLTSPYSSTRISFQLCDEQYTSTSWLPNVHYYLYGVGHEYDYPNYTFTTGGAAVWKNLKLAYTSAGVLRPYLNNVCLDWGLEYDWPYGPSQTASKTQYELGSESRTVVPHDPANHHAGIQNRGSDYSSWSYQTSSVPVSIRNVVIDYGVSPSVEYSGLYWFDIQSANYDWLARD